MKILFFVLLLWIFRPVGTGQLILPDFVEDEEAPPGSSSVHASENGAEESGSSGGVSEDQRFQEPQMRQMMQAMQVRRPRIRQADEHEEGARDLFQLLNLSDGPEWLVLELEEASGRTTRLNAPNQTFMFRTRAGDMPIRLNEVKEMIKEDDGEGFLLRMHSKDRVAGIPGVVLVPEGDEESGLLSLPLYRLKAIRPSLSE